MPNVSHSNKPRAHVCGIGGAAMVAGARLAIEAGWEVRGSDNPLYPPTSDMVKSLGVPVAEGYAAANLDWKPDVVIIGNVLSRGNVEVEAALSRRMRYLSLPEWLKEHVLRARRPVAICGTHGKTTTTAITAYLLDACGLNPGFLIGGQPLDFEHSARLGPEGAPFVIEGDEYDTAFFDKRAKFLHYLPEIAVVTSIEFDHGDIYRDIEEIETAFQRMLRQVPKEGLLLAWSGSPRTRALCAHAYSKVESYGFEDDAYWRAQLGEVDGAGRTKMIVHRNGQEWGTVRVPLAGRHNALNALAAVAVAANHGASACAVADALAAFKGVRRRMEVFLETNGVTFVDDFAHHPTAIRETIAAARHRWPTRRLCVVFEPRSNTTVTNVFQHELVEAFRAADEVWLGPIHRADTIPEDTRLDRDAVIRLLAQSGASGRAVDRVEEIVAGLKKTTRTGDIVLILSNGAFGGIYQKLRVAFSS
ncbi:MAG: UDP-N-acetylmuramate:L-alanyl-gamma-D-glutamyl-meso-diaminopimelate ligase [Candidatus Hydrogenedentes bacterium]|nr:UDP-N-acetylmuramate:L-alanyl-gamma-D-glutamyl-meso-diaminopimelate ligase [Candidatus Hydrogenedentota bacterium]